MQPFRPPVQIGEISEQELKEYDGSDSKKPLLVEIKGQIFDVSQSSFNEVEDQGSISGDFCLYAWALVGKLSDTGASERFATMMVEGVKTYELGKSPLFLVSMASVSWNKMKRTGICGVIHIWEDLESPTVPGIENSAYVLELQKFCRVQDYDPLLRSMRYIVLSKPALIIILVGFKELEVLNISHCLIIEDPPPAPMKVLTKLDESVLEKAFRSHKFLTCMSDSCIISQRLEMMKGS
ncbi:Membrane steroid-binding protein 2 [Capsicum baccatum]|uniref:Membrane steroid-binding protein 2 n=1 Tax=Capsicum baccatum TaxID=33114 RepID=A0A2G2X6M7_CAPBA|nr:Membrane steroid-binding protein 2 [Capsicum baccatum]